MAIRRRSGGTTLVGDERHRSPTQISPASGRRNPATRRSVVVLPQPDGPRSETSSPGSTRRSSPSSAARSPYRFVSPLIVTPGMGSRSVLRADDVATEQRLHHDDGGEGHAEHKEAEDRDGAELALLLQVEDHDRDHLGAGREEDDRRRQLTDHADEDEAPGGDDAAPGERRRDLAEHAQAPRTEDASRLLELGVDSLEGRVGLRVARRL